MKKEKRGLFHKIFGRKNKLDGNYTFLELLKGFSPFFSDEYGETIYNNNKARTCINTIATHCAKIEPQHIQIKNGTRQQIFGEINYLLSNQPNAYMTSYDFLYKTISILETDNNCFIYINKNDKGMITGFYPLSYDNVTLLQDKDEIFAQFRFQNGNTYITDYKEIIHLRKFFNRHDIYGESNQALDIPIQTAQTTNEGIINAIKMSMSLKGLIKYKGLTKEKDLKINRDNFVKNFIDMEKSSGVAALDERASFEPLNIEPITLDENQLEFVNNNIFDYFSLNENIIRSKFNEEEWNAFFESVIEPISIMLGQAFTNTIFSKEAIKKGHKIIFNVNRIKYAKTETKVTLLEKTAILGLYTTDEAREILDLNPLGGVEGAKRVQTLNVVNAEKADQYQLGGKKNEKSNSGNKTERNESNSK